MTNNKWILTQTVLLMAVAGVTLTACQNEAVKPIDKTAIPPACISSGSKPVYTLTSSSGYNEKRAPYSPIRWKNGFISHDFNKDGLLDYIFLEQKNGTSGAILKTCISDKKQTSNYQSRKTRNTFREYKSDAENYVESGEVSFENNKLEITYGSHAHNDGGQGNTKKYTFDTKKNNFILTWFNYSGHGDAYGDNYYVYDLDKRTYHSESRCTFPNYWGDDPDGCKPKTINRCLNPDSSGGQMQLGEGVSELDLEKMLIDC